MKVLYWSLGLFLIGLLEFWIDQHQKVVLSRLKLWQSVFFQLMNQYFTFFVNVYAFGIIMDFWNQVKTGVYDTKTLFPYLSYIHGCVAGTAVALVVYIHNKKKKDHERTLKLISKTDKKGKKRSKKKYNKMVNDAVTKMSTETLLDPIETEDLKEQIKQQVVESVTQKISDKVDKALDQENNS
jgi:hypothetical protein